MIFIFVYTHFFWRLYMNQHKMETIETLTGVKLFEYTGDDSISSLLYEIRIVNRIKKDIQFVLDTYKNESFSYIVHELYPQCYILIWQLKDQTQKRYIYYSEVLFVDEFRDNPLVVCCEKCNRRIEIRSFKNVSNDFIHLLGENFIHIFQSNSLPETHIHSNRSQDVNYNTQKVCNLVIQNEVDQNFELEMPQLIEELSYALLDKNHVLATKYYNGILNQIKKTPYGVSIDKKIAYQTPALITALIYQLSTLSPSHKENLYTTGYTLIHAFMTLKTASKQLDFLQNLAKVFIELLHDTSAKNFNKSVQKTLQYIHKNYTMPITLEEVGNTLGMNTSYISKEFKKALGQSFSTYLKQYRINRSILMMKNPTYSLTDIALNVGFDSSTYFSTSFKQIMGMTPSEFRGKHLK